MITLIIYKIVYSADTNSILSCDAVGVITSEDCNINHTCRVLDIFITYIQAHSEEEAKIQAMKIVESWVE